jgi:Predicted membrane protein
MNRERSGMERLETTIGEVLRFGTITSSTMFAVGLLITVTGYQPMVAQLLLGTGLIILLATPPARVVVSVIEYIREGDWTFVVLTLIVLMALAGSVVAAYL